MKTHQVFLVLTFAWSTVAQAAQWQCFEFEHRPDFGEETKTVPSIVVGQSTDETGFTVKFYKEIVALNEELGDQIQALSSGQNICLKGQAPSTLRSVFFASELRK